MIRTAAELIGLALLVVAAFLIHPAAGFAVAGIALILAANFGGRLDDPAQPPRKPER